MTSADRAGYIFARRCFNFSRMRKTMPRIKEMIPAKMTNKEASIFCIAAV